MAASAFSSGFVSSVEDFRALFAPNSDDRLLLCYEAYHDEVTTADLTALEDAVRSAAVRHATKVQLHFWDCGSDAFLAAKEQLGKVRGTPLLAVVYRQAIADTLKGPVEVMIEDVDNVCRRLSSYQHGGKVAVFPISLPRTTADAACISVDVSRLVGVGKRLMTEGKADYAEKFFTVRSTPLTRLGHIATGTRMSTEAPLFAWRGWHWHKWFRERMQMCKCGV
ncbi:hypothetical protein TcG_08387 [Trypanosoma cruzi]|nr:hypothetical protein TcG_08387 [Trypanosoma cruzi]